MRSSARASNVSHERWLVSYADFITLLFAFFVVMYAFAKTGANQQHQVSTAIEAAFQSMGMPVQPVEGPPADNGPAPGVVMDDTVLSPNLALAGLERMENQLSSTLAPELAAHTVSLGMGRDGLVISLREVGFFASGSATPKSAALPTLRRIATALGSSPYNVRVEGHTDNVPVHNAQFDSNWELSTARATAIARLLLALKAVPPDRLSAAGYAQFHPVASNATAAGRAQNRRVDLVILPRSAINFAKMAASQTNSPSTTPDDSRNSWRRITDSGAAENPLNGSPLANPR